MKIALPALLFALVVSAAPARAEQHDSIGGAGAFTCSDFSKEYEQDPMSELTFFTWAQGFMSGLNALATPANVHDLAAQPFTAQEAFVRTYCKLNPASSYAVGVSELYATLPLSGAVANPAPVADAASAPAP